MPPLEALAAVVAAHRAGSFTAAAETLGITHGTISRRVHAVEHWLGTPLFKRMARGVSTTPAGQRFVAQVEQALAAIRDSADQWRPRRDLPVVRLSVVPSFARLWLLPKLAALQGNPPYCRIDLLTEHRVLDIGAGQTDLAVRYGKGRWPGVAARLLFAENLFPVASPQWAAQWKVPPTAAEIAQLPLLHDSDTSQWRRWLHAAGSTFRVKDADRRFEEYDLVLAAAEAGLGIALLRSPLADEWLHARRLVRVAAQNLPNPAGHYLAMAAGETRAAVLQVASMLFEWTTSLRDEPTATPVDA